MAQMRSQSKLVTKTETRKIGNRLHGFREAAGYTRAEVARLFDCSTKKIWYWEVGVTGVQLQDAVVLAKLYGVSVADILGEK